MSVFCKPYRLDRFSNGGTFLVYIREDMPSRLLTEYKQPENVECLFVEINIRKKKWFLRGSYSPHRNNISNHLHHLNKDIDVYLKHYDNLLISGDLNVGLRDNCLNAFFLMLTILKVLSKNLLALKTQTTHHS